MSSERSVQSVITEHLDLHQWSWVHFPDSRRLEGSVPIYRDHLPIDLRDKLERQFIRDGYLKGGIPDILATHLVRQETAFLEIKGKRGVVAPTQTVWGMSLRASYITCLEVWHPDHKKHRDTFVKAMRFICGNCGRCPDPLEVWSQAR